MSGHTGWLNCACPDPACRARRSAYRRTRYVAARSGQPHLKMPILGAQRRVHALMAIGWTGKHIACAGGISTVDVLRVCRGAHPLIFRRTHDGICRAYERLSMTPGPSTHTRRYAANHSWAPPLAWDEGTLDDPHATPDRDGEGDRDLIDIVAVERAARGWPVDLTTAERREAVRVLVGRGASSIRIAGLLNVDPRQVDRDRAWLRRQREAA
jgi:hypothetical protein